MVHAGVAQLVERDPSKVDVASSSLVSRCSPIPTLPCSNSNRCGVDLSRSDIDNDRVSDRDIDDYLANLDEPRRSTLSQLRQTIVRIIPDAEQCVSYGVPAFRLHGKVVAGFAAFKNHLSYLPHSGSVFPELRDDLADYPTSSGALRFPIDNPLPTELVEKLIAARINQVLQRQ
jgi:uncharacterized protein YdhG (YjbR/CyaY superfamily)